MTPDQHRSEIDAFFGLSKLGPQLRAQSDLGRALYAMSELGMWPDSVDSVGKEQAIFCWTIVEKLRVQQFPEELRM